MPQETATEIGKFEGRETECVNYEICLDAVCCGENRDCEQCGHYVKRDDLSGNEVVGTGIITCPVHWSH